MTNTTTNIIEDLTLLPLPQWWQSPWVIVAFLVVATLLGLLLFRFVNRVRPQVFVRAAPVGPPPHEEALRRLATLRTRQPSLGAHELAIEVSEILRDYVSARFGLPVRFQTTREFLDAAVRNPALSAIQREELGRFLGFCDLVKFARQPATATEQVGLLNNAETFIRNSAGTPSPS